MINMWGEKKRRPTARDRDIVDYIENLALGNHTILIEEPRLVPLKIEGSLTLFDIYDKSSGGYKNIVIIQERKPSKDG